MGNNSESNTPSYELFYDHIFNPNYELNELDDYTYKEIDDNNMTMTNESTDISEKNIILKNIIFGIKKEKKEKKALGRKRKIDNTKNEKTHTHSKYDYDNIIRKIQVHFQNFLISFTNEILIHFGFNNKRFLNIEYNNKKDIKKETVEKLKSKEIGQILRQNISTKYKKQYKEDKGKNNKLYLEVTKNAEYDSIRKILSETYINIFRNFYYLNKKDLNDYGLNITLSNNVKTYKDLLENLSKQSEDDKYIEKIKEIVNECYLPKKRFINN